MKHKVISLLQPWASLVVMGHKHIETRSFQRAYRGPLLIHASAGKNGIGERLANCEASELLSEHIIRKKIRDGFEVFKSHYRGLPFGAIIGSVNLISIEPSERSTMAESVTFNGHTWNFTDQEKAFGDFGRNRFLWLLSDPVMFKEPVPAKGNLGIWQWEGDIPA